MKFSLLILSAIVLATSCKSKTRVLEDTSLQLTDSIANQATINELPEKETTLATEPVAVAKKKAPAKQATTKSTTSNSTSTNSTSTSSTGNGTETTTTTTTQKTGWSKTAKGAVIGGVVGAGTGAVVNKKNPAAGAVIGGVVGAGAGAVIGNEADKKDGRH